MQAPAGLAPLPEGWEQRDDPRTGRIYYVNHVTKETSWTLPVHPRPARAVCLCVRGGAEARARG